MAQSKRLGSQIKFIVEIDALKRITRQTMLMDSSRNENDAEHSWHVATMALVLSEYGAKNIDIWRVIKMLLIHDVVEIDAGDTFCYDEEGQHRKVEREQHAADRIFSLLPQDQAEDFRKLWDEFEERKTPEARFAAACDRLQPILQNYQTQGYAWKKHDIKRDMVVRRNEHIAEGAPSLWEFVKNLIDDAVHKGYLEM